MNQLFSKVFFFFLLPLILIILACQPRQHTSDGPAGAPVKISGAMRNVMMKGELGPTLWLDTLAPREHLYGIGPADSLLGEIMIINGRSYVSTILNDSLMSVAETFDARAPFFVYAYVTDWRVTDLPDSIRKMDQLETYLDVITGNNSKPFSYRLAGIAETSTVHVVNLPKGSVVTSAADAHRGELKFKIENETVEIVGFFSRKHKGIFTHHDSNVHMHLITADRSKMGHLEDIVFTGPVKIYFPGNRDIASASMHEGNRL